MKNKATTTVEMFYHIQGITLFAHSMLQRVKENAGSKENAAIKNSLAVYGITEERIDAIRDFYTSSDYIIFGEAEE